MLVLFIFVILSIKSILLNSTFIMAISSGNQQVLQGSLTCCLFYRGSCNSPKNSVSKTFQSCRLTLNHIYNQYKYLLVHLFSAGRTGPDELIWPCELPRSAESFLSLEYAVQLGEPLSLVGTFKLNQLKFLHVLFLLLLLLDKVDMPLLLDLMKD